MDNKKDANNLSEKSTSEILIDFGEDFGVISKQNISDIFLEIHGSVSPLDPLNKVAPSEVL
jgi:hypothetical protein